MDDLLQLLGSKIKNERKKRGLTQEKLAGLSGVSNNFISYIESGNKNASLKTIKKIADVFQISLSDLFSEMGVTKKSKPDATANKLLYLIQDEGPATKEFIFEVCKAIIQARKKKKQ
ncbi:MAG: helix-turn-helix domain-containing protein [Proteobacteria bacterium]|nr:helix-turn-helix domain-containing protein [Pseudomonadota bacterium]